MTDNEGRTLHEKNYLIQKAQVYGVLPRVMSNARRLNDGMGAYVANQTIKYMNKKGVMVKDSKTTGSTPCVASWLANPPTRSKPPSSNSSKKNIPGTWNPEPSLQASSFGPDSAKTPFGRISSLSVPNQLPKSAESAHRKIEKICALKNTLRGSKRHDAIALASIWQGQTGLLSLPTPCEVLANTLPTPCLLD